MSFFAGFVNGVMQGQDRREGQKDRAIERTRNESRWDWEQENREWAGEDREYTLSERARVARERQQGRARAAAARSEAEARRQEEAAAWGLSFDGTGAAGGSASGGTPARQEPISIWYDEPVTNRAAPAAGNAATASAAPAREPRPETPRNRSRDNKMTSPDRYDPIPVTDIAQDQAAPVPSPMMEANDPLPTAASVRRDVSRRGGSAQEYWNALSPEQQGAYTRVQMPGRVPVTADAGADYMMPHAVNPSYIEPSDPEGQTRRFATRAAAAPIAVAPTPPPERFNDAPGDQPSQIAVAPLPPQRVDPTMDDIEARLAQASQPAAPDRAAIMASQAQAAMPTARAPGGVPRAEPISLPESITRPAQHQRSQEQIDADIARMPAAFRGEPIAPRTPDAPPPPPTGVAAEMRQQSQADRGAIVSVSEALSTARLGAPDPSMTAQERAVRSQLEGMTQTPGRPLSMAARASAPGNDAFSPAPTTPTPTGRDAAAAQGRNARGPVSVRPEVQQQAQAAPEQAPRTASGTPAVSVQAVARETVAAAQQGGRGNMRQQRQQVADRFVERYQRDAIPPIVQLYIRRGQIERARAAMGFFNDLEVQRGMRSWAQALHAYSVNDVEGMVESLIETHENQGYYADGLSALRPGARGSETQIIRNDAGEVVGADITLRDNATGRTFTQRIRGVDDLLAMGVQTLSPEAALEQFLGQSETRRENRPEPPSVSDMRQIREQAYEEVSQGGVTQPTAEAVEERMRQILSSMGVAASGVGSRGSVPVMY